MTYALYARKGWGSAISEAMLAYASLDYELRDPKGNRAKGVPPLKEINPLVQFPTLVCPDGHIMTESAAILFHIDDMAPKAGLVPKRTRKSDATFCGYF